MENKKKSINYKIAVTGALGALTIVLGITKWGIIPISPVVSLTIMQIPVILAALLAGLVPGISVGAIFGIFSLIIAATSPVGALDPLFVNPLVSVLPRILIGVMTWIVFKLLNKIPHMPLTISGAVASFIGSLSNTFFVIGSLYLIYHDKMLSNMGNLGFFAGLGLLMPNALLESAAAVIITVTVFISMFAVKNKKSKLSKEADE